jgi:hypothetical protein
MQRILAFSFGLALLLGATLGGAVAAFSTGGAATGHLAVDVTANNPPVANDDAASGTEDTDVTIAAATLLANDTDPDSGDTLSVSDVSGATGGSVSLDAGAALITFTPAANRCGPGAAAFDYTATDGNGGSDTGHVTIDLACVNDPPVAVDDLASTQRDQAVPAVFDVLANDTDVDGDTLLLTAAEIDDPTHGSVFTWPSNHVVYYPATGLYGTAVITYTVDDGNGGSDTGTLTVTILPDVTPPEKVVGPELGIAAAGRVDASAPVIVGYGAADSDSGVASYQLQLSLGGKPFHTIYTGPDHRMRQVYSLGRSVVLRVRATDYAGNTSEWAVSPRYQLVAIQNSSKSVGYSSPWTVVRSPSSSGDGYSYTTRRGSSARYHSGFAWIAYVAAKMPAGGYVKVYQCGGGLFGRYSLRSSTVAHGRIIASYMGWGSYSNRSIKVVNDQAGRRATLDTFLVLRILN